MFSHPFLFARVPDRFAPRFAAPLLGLLLAAALLAACGDSSSDAGAQSGKTFTYTVTDSGGQLVPGRRVVIVDGSINGTCTSGTGNPIQHSGDAVVTTPGTVTITFSLDFPGAYRESVYIDVDGSNTLTPGDLVWGTNPLGFAATCISSMSAWQANQSFDWSAIAAAGPGSTVYAGGAAPFAAEPGQPTPFVREEPFQPWQPDAY